MVRQKSDPSAWRWEASAMSATRHGAEQIIRPHGLPGRSKQAHLLLVVPKVHGRRELTHHSRSGRLDLPDNFSRQLEIGRYAMVQPEASPPKGGPLPCLRPRSKNRDRNCQPGPPVFGPCEHGQGLERPPATSSVL